MNKRVILFFILSFFILSFSCAAERLFVFERSTNKNYICYDVNIKDGKLNTKEPVHAYWIRAEEGGEKKELSYLQFNFAFGFSYSSEYFNGSFNDLLIQIKIFYF